MNNRSTQPDERFISIPKLGNDSSAIISDFTRYFSCTLGRDQISSSPQYLFQALALTLRDRLIERANRTRHAYANHRVRQVCYLSLEYLIGRSLEDTLLNLGLQDTVNQALDELGLQLADILEQENDAGLGNGGLGRLAVCLLDSCATLQLPVIGYGLRYEYGMFRQNIQEGHQVEEPDAWLRDGHPWELCRQELAQRVEFGGRSEHYLDSAGQKRWRWVDTHDVLALPYDLPVPGYRNDTVNTLRLWSANATDKFDLDEFNAGSYPEAVAAKTAAEAITLVLYPNDASENGKELRLRQQYFLASASLKDTLRRWIHYNGPVFDHFAAQHCFQLNDTHPSIAVAELMRLLMDVHGLGWDKAWEITTSTMAYTNHTLLPEALERWPVRLFEQLLPRHLDIIYAINAWFLSEVASRWPGDQAILKRLSLIEEAHEPMVRMAYLAIVGSFSVNGVAELHSKLLCEGLFRDFHALWPKRFNNKTNGVTPSRWLASCNPPLSELITDTIGPDWVTDLERLRGLQAYATDRGFQSRWAKVRAINKHRLAERLRQECGVVFEPSMLFDVQVKRIHEYKRQLLNVLHIIYRYQRLKSGDHEGLIPRCVLIGGKAAPGYTMAKLIIKLVNNVAKVVNRDPDLHDWLRGAFLPNYRVSTMEWTCPGTDLSEQISTAGKEASGTGNMKFMMNGALTIGTLDGANIEIRDAVGAEHFFLFGMDAEQAETTRKHYDPQSIIAADSELKAVIQLLENDHFSLFETGLFRPIIDALRNPADPWLTVADFRSYIDAQLAADARFANQTQWLTGSILNTAASGGFSSDRTIADYNRDIWRLNPTAALVD